MLQAGTSSNVRGGAEGNAQNIRETGNACHETGNGYNVRYPITRRGSIMKQFMSAPRNWIWVLCSAAAVLFSAGALADPPSRVARLTQIGGSVSFSPAG